MRCKKNILAIGLLSILILASCSLPVDEAANEIAFVNVSIVYADDSRIEPSQTIIVRNNKIIRVGPADDIRIRAGSTRVDGTGKYLTPGLVEMHGHVPKVAEGREYLEDMLFLWVANGVTTIRNMNGEPAHIELREQLKRDELVGPRLYTAGPPFQGSKIKTAAEAEQVVAMQAEAGYDLLKVHMGLPLATYEGVIAGAARNNMTFAGHVSGKIGLWRALEAGQKSIDHLDSYLPALVPEETDVSAVKDSLLGMPYTPFVDTERINLVAAATAKADVWNAPTLTLAQNFVGPFDESAELRGSEYMPPRMVRGWATIARGFQKSIEDPEMAQRFLSYRMQLVQALHTAGAKILLGSDAPQVLNVPGFSTHDELSLLVRSGLTPAEALTAGTSNPARYFGAEDEFGRIQEGLSADLILVDSNPLEDIGALRNPRGVMLRGKWLTAEQLAAGLAEIAAQYRD